MLTPKLQELAQFKAKVEQLEKSIVAERQGLLARLHLEVGFSSRAELIKALRALGNSSGLRGRPRGTAKAHASASKGRRRRAKVTPELRGAIIAAIKGGATGGATAAKFKVSLPTVQNIKRAAGLTRKAKN